MEAGREIFWNIGVWGNLVYVLSAVALALLIWAFYRRVKLWRSGKPDNRAVNPGRRITPFIQKVLGEILAQKKILRERFPGIMHLILFWAFLSFFAITTADFIHHYFFSFLKGSVYLWFSLIVDLFGLLALFAILGMAYVRYVQKPERLDNRPGDAIALILLFLMILTGFLTEGSRLAATEMIHTPQYAPWSIGGWFFGKIFFGWGPSVHQSLHKIWWFLHLAVVIGAGIYVALSFSKLVHIVVAPLNIFFRSLRPRGELLPIDFETAEEFGVGGIKGFTWKHLMDLDACTRCGRCQDNCPAHLSGKVLSPKNIIQDLKGEMEKGWALFPGETENGSQEGEGPESLLVGETISKEALWDCTTCSACMEACPVYVEHVDKMVDMRRGEVLNERGIPQDAQETLRNMEIRGNPWRGAEYLRDEWTKGLTIKTLSEDGDADWLLWVGCTGALVDRNIQVTRTFAEQLMAAEVDFGILGIEEVCCGDPARRMGHELQFQMMAQQNIEVMKGYGVKKIVTPCPHCYNTLKNEYPQFGGEFEVWHHSELLLHLIGEGRLNPQKPLNKRITYHDPCYLGRYNGLLEVPRKLLESIPGLQLVEMEKCRESSFCCGGGGGHAWMEEPVGRRINQMRLEQGIDINAAVIGLACPFCMQMMEDAITSFECPMEALDVSELIAESCNPESK
ncbi:MAG: 4Fe-4S dicluster domain-containing protein [Deltaproteobacteria bacterium]|nr:4Fe-4S dicluster domain-containing protein [Deltaproteobacteria bacterium]